MLNQLSYINKEEFFIIFSHSENSKEVQFLINHLKNEFIEYCLITSSNDENFLNNLVIKYESQDIHKQELETSSVSQNFIVDLILEYIKYKKNIKDNKRLIDDWKQKVKK